jgi:hypothetical protein
MPIDTDLTAIVAQDGFDEYYAEKLWNWIPAFYREQDASTPTAGTLRGLVESMGLQAAEVRRSLDRIWENAFVELADDDALEALGRLVATRMVHGLNRRARRVDVARTIYYRRRKGTPRVLESLLTDITGWTGAHLESRHRLARTYHLLEPAPDLAAAIFTHTPRGGWANLRSPRIPALAYTAFEELAHTPDFRRLSGIEGRYGIPKVNVHLHRARAFAVHYPTIVQIGPAPEGVDAVWPYALDPSGRELQLFAPSNRPSSDSWARMREWQLAKAIERRLLDHNEYEWSKAQLVPLAATFDEDDITKLEKYAGWRVPNLRELERLMPLLSAEDMAALMHETMIPQCGRRQLYGSDRALSLAIGTDIVAPDDVGGEELQIGNLTGWGATWSYDAVFDIDKADHKLVVDPERGAVLSRSTDDDENLLIVPVYHYGFPGAVGAGTYDRRESIVTVGVFALPAGGNDVGRVDSILNHVDHPVEELENNKTYVITGNLSNVENYRLQASDLTRPYLVHYTESPDTAVWEIEAADPVEGELRSLVLDGLWIGFENDAGPQTVEPGVPAVPVASSITLTGTWDRVEINHCTLDPGGEQMRYIDPDDDEEKCRVVKYVILEIAGYIEELVIDHSIVGPILGTLAGLNTCSVGKLIIRDSIVMSIDSDIRQVIDVALGNVHIERSTILGGITANRLYVTDSLVTGTGAITDRQNGCFRFSAGVNGDWPRPYESHFLTEFDPAWIESQRFGDPNFTRLSDAAPLEIRTGAENHCEMGVWNHLLEEIKHADLRAKLGEFMPFDLDMQLVTET